MTARAGSLLGVFLLCEALAIVGQLIAYGINPAAYHWYVGAIFLIITPIYPLLRMSTSRRRYS